MEKMAMTSFHGNNSRALALTEIALYSIKLRL